MKNFIFTLISLFIFISCNDNELKIPEDQALQGKWKMVERWLGNVGDLNSDEWTETPNGYEMSFMDGGGFTSTENNVCQNEINIGKYTIIEDSASEFKIFEIAIKCSSTGNELIRKYTYDFKQDHLIISPYSHPCPEGCLFKFKRISSQ